VTDERGVALVVALLAMVLVAALGVALSLVTSAEGRIAAHYGSGVEALHAADAAIELAVLDLERLSDWNTALEGMATASVIDGSPGLRTLPDGSTCRRPPPSLRVVSPRVAVRIWMRSRRTGPGVRTTRGGSSLRTGT
jgi:Tfp pilus assembly protein PilX